MKTGKRYMDEFLAKKGMVRLVDLKVGDKFYNMDWQDEKIYELVNLTRTLDEADEVEYDVREIGKKHITHIKLSGFDVIRRTVVLRFRGRDRGSFIAGFKAAMRHYQKYMQVFDRENAGLDDLGNTWKTMTDEYHKWMKNT